MASDERGGEGRVVAHFRLVRRLGEGGMGVVHEAEDLTLQRRVALKLLRSNVDDEGERQRLLREARTAARLVHPNIVTVFEVGEHEGTVFVAMELVVGESLRERLGAGPLPPEQARRLAIGLARALSRAHAAGVVHRDIKPENVMLDATVGAKLLDFGIAKATVGDSPLAATMDGPLVTLPGVVVGTPAYMAPEQLRGEITDARTDVFAFGTVLYEMLSGENPHARPTLSETVAAILRDEPTAITVRSARDAALAAVVARCLTKSPAKRFADGTELLAALEGRNVTAAFEPTISMPSARAERPTNRARVFVGAAIAVVVATAVVAFSMRASRESEPAQPSSSVSPAAPPVDWERAKETKLPLGGLADDFFSWSVSGDGHRVLVGSHRTLVIRPTGPGELTTVALPASLEGKIIGVSLLADESILVTIVASAGEQEVWRFPAGGAPPVRLARGVARVFPAPTGTVAVYCRGAVAFIGWFDADKEMQFGSCDDIARGASWSPSEKSFLASGASPAGATLMVVGRDGVRRTILSDPALTADTGGGAVFFDATRVLVLRYPTPTGAPRWATPDTELMELRLDAAGNAMGAPRRVRRWSSAELTEPRIAGGRLWLRRSDQRWDVLGGRASAPAEAHVIAAETAHLEALAADGTPLVLSHHSGPARLYSKASAEAPFVRVSDVEEEEQAALMSDGGLVVVRGPTDGNCRHVRARFIDGRLADELPLATRPANGRDSRGVRCERVTCASRKPVCVLASSVGNGTWDVLRYDPSNGQTGASLGTLEGNASFDLSPDGDRLLVTNEAHSFTLWDIASNVRRVVPLVAPGTAQFGRFFPDGKRVLFSGFDYEGHVFALWTSDLEGHTAPLQASETTWFQRPRFSRDGKQWAYGRKTYSRSVWSLDPAEPPSSRLALSFGREPELLEERAHVVALHAAATSHLRHVARRRGDQIAEIRRLELLNGGPLRLGELGRRAAGAARDGVAAAAFEGKHEVERLGGFAEGGEHAGDVDQLAHVAGPIVVTEAAFDLGGDRLAAGLFLQPRARVSHDGGDVLAALAQRR